MEINSYFYDLAKISANKAAEHGVTVDPKWIYTQWYHETGGFTSSIQSDHHNLGGIMSSSGDWMHFSSFGDFADYFGRYLAYYAEDGLSHATNFYSYLSALHKGGYFTSDLDAYYQVCLAILNSLPF